VRDKRHLLAVIVEQGDADPNRSQETPASPGIIHMDQFFQCQDLGLMHGVCLVCHKLLSRMVEPSILVP
jgi:hypothetical protein